MCLGHRSSHPVLGLVEQTFWYNLTKAEHTILANCSAHLCNVSGQNDPARNVTINIRGKITVWPNKTNQPGLIQEIRETNEVTKQTCT